MMGEYDDGYEHYIDSLIREIEKLQDENDKLREQVSSLVGRSFRTADKMSCIEADNDRLRDELDAAKHDLSLFSERIVELGAENSNLRESLEFANNECEKDSIEFLNLQADNAKLRELLLDVHALGCSGFDCTECPIAFAERCNDEYSGCEWVSILTDRMRELGVEVDE